MSLFSSAYIFYGLGNMPLYAFFHFTLGNRTESYEASLKGFVLELWIRK